MKKIFIVLLAPLFMAIQCEKEPIYENIYRIQNNSTYDLILITQEHDSTIANTIESKSEYYFIQVTDSYSLIPPSENIIFNEIILFREDSNGNQFITYEQVPIQDDLWILDSSAGDGIENPNYNVWVLSITDDLLN